MEDIISTQELDSHSHINDLHHSHIRINGVGYNEAEALAHIISKLQVKLQSLIIREELDLYHNSDKYAIAEHDDSNSVFIDGINYIFERKPIHIGDTIVSDGKTIVYDATIDDVDDIGNVVISFYAS